MGWRARAPVFARLDLFLFSRVVMGRSASLLSAGFTLIPDTRRPYLQMALGLGLPSSSLVLLEKSNNIPTNWSSARRPERSLFFPENNVSPIPNSQSSILNPQSAILNPQSSIPNPQSAILNPQSPIPNPQSPTLNPQFSIPNPQSPILNHSVGYFQPQGARILSRVRITRRDSSCDINGLSIFPSARQRITSSISYSKPFSRRGASKSSGFRP